MRAFITGITGFVGAHLTEHLQTTGDALLGSARNPVRALGPHSAVRPAPEVLAWNVADSPADEVRRRVAEFAPEVIYHLAAFSVPRDCGDIEPTPTARSVNVDGVRHVLELAQTLSARPRIVLMSSGRVYAPVDPNAPSVSESSPLGPLTAYGKTKCEAEAVCREAVNRTGLDVVIVRSFSQSGPGMDERLMLAEWTVQLLRGGDQPVDVASLDVTTDVLDVRDGVRALRLLAQRGAGGETYNLGSGVSRTTGDVFRLLRKHFDEAREVRQLRPGRRCDPIADVDKLRAAVGWSPQIPLEQTVADVVSDWRRRLSG